MLCANCHVLDPSTKQLLINSLLSQQPSPPEKNINNNPQPQQAEGHSTNSQHSIHQWTGNQEDLLVCLRHERDEAFKKTKNHNILWNEIVNEISKTLKITVTSTQAMNKYFTLKKMERNCRLQDWYRGQIIQTQR